MSDTGEGGGHELRGIAQLADRAVPPRRAALVYALVLLALAALAEPIAHAIYDTVDREPTALAAIRERADPAVSVDRAVRPLVIVLVDGLRLDESRRLTALSALARRGAHGVVDLPLPTLSRPYYHAMLTGVPPAGSGVRKNREGQRALVDSLTDRVRDAGGSVAFIADRLDWMAVMHGAPSDFDAHGADAFDAPLSGVLRELERAEGPTLTVIHAIRVDDTAHQAGVKSRAHRRALSEVNALIARVASQVGDRARLAVVSDHGHIERGGHGGDEPEVRHAPFVLAGPSVPRVRLDRMLAVEELAPTFAAWIGVPPPRSAVATVAPELAPPEAMRLDTSAIDPNATVRRALLEGATRRDAARGRRDRTWLLALAGLFAIMTLGTTKRAFAGFDVGTIIAPATLLAMAWALHGFVLERPFSMSALDDAFLQSARLALVGFVGALVGIGTGTLVARERAGGDGRFVPHLRRGAGAVGWSSVAASMVTIAWLGGALGPWPLSALGYYAPILVVATGGGACIAAAVVLLLTIVRRRMEI